MIRIRLHLFTRSTTQEMANAPAADSYYDGRMQSKVFCGFTTYTSMTSMNE